MGLDLDSQYFLDLLCIGPQIGNNSPLGDAHEN